MPEKKTININGTIREFQKKDISIVLKLHNETQKDFKLKYKLTQDEMMHYVLGRDDIVKTFVIENMIDGKMTVTDFFSIIRTTQKCIN